MSQTPDTKPRPRGGRRTMWILIGCAVLMVLGFLAFAGAYTFYSLRTPTSAQVSTALPGDVPSDVFLCDHFRTNHSISSSTGSSKHFQVVGDCPVGALQL